MSPLPVNNNDPGKDCEGDDVESTDVPTTVNPMVMMDSSDDDEPEGYMDPEIGYQLLAQGPDFPGAAIPGISDDDDTDDDEDGGGGDGGIEENYTNLDSENLEDSHAQTDSTLASHIQVPPLGETHESKELRELWKAPRETVELNQMAPEHADEIKAMMAGFSLPAANLPDWANVVPESEWKDQLLSRLSYVKCSATAGSARRKPLVGNNDSVMNSCTSELPGNTSSVEDRCDSKIADNAGSE